MHSNSPAQSNIEEKTAPHEQRGCCADFAQSAHRARAVWLFWEAELSALAHGGLWKLLLFCCLYESKRGGSPAAGEILNHLPHSEHFQHICTERHACRPPSPHNPNKSVWCRSVISMPQFLLRERIVRHASPKMYIVETWTYITMNLCHEPTSLVFGTNGLKHDTTFMSSIES